MAALKVCLLMYLNLNIFYHIVLRVVKVTSIIKTLSRKSMAKENRINAHAVKKMPATTRVIGSYLYPTETIHQRNLQSDI